MHKLLLVFALVVISSATQAESPAFPEPKHLYQDADAGAKVPRGLALQTFGTNALVESKRLIARYSKQIERDPNNPESLAARGFHYVNIGEYEKAEADFQTALRLPIKKEVQLRFVHWSYGWSLFHQRRDQEALDQWQIAERMAGNNPFWVPYTYALPLWRMGQRELAVSFYDSAVRSDRAWGREKDLEILTAHWQPMERSLLNAIYNEWNQKRSEK